MAAVFDDNKIDFHNSTTDKPANLANSAVLRMLEEEERTRRGYPKLDPTQVEAILDTLVYRNRQFEFYWPRNRSAMRSARSWDGQLNVDSAVYPEFLNATKGQKKVVWPPVPEANGYHSPQNQQQAPAYYNNTAHAPASQQHSPAPNQSYKQPQYHPQQAYQSQQQHSPYKTQPQQYQQPQAYSDGLRQESTGLSKLIPVGPGVSASPTRAAPLSPTAQRQQNRWAPVAAPTSPQAYGTQPAYPSQQQAYPSQQQQHSPQPLYAPKPFEPPPATITLRPQQPVHQQPPPVFPSQPATASFKGGVNMRGDQKWPPQSVREAVAAENEARRLLAKGPACRPRKVHKDYTPFFAKHALTHNYPGYRAPPGTQHYEDHSGRSSY